MKKKTKSPEKAGAIREAKEGYVVGPGKPPLHTRFTSENQPDPEKAKATKAHKKFTRKVLEEMINRPYKFKYNSQIKDQLREAFGDEIDNMTAMEIASLQQIQKAILKADTQSFTELLNQALGKAIQPVANVNPDGSPLEQRKIILTLPKGMNIDLPSNIEGEGEEEEK